MATTNTNTSTAATETARGRLPSHEVFEIIEDGETKTWKKLGAAWPTAKGDGYNVEFKEFPSGEWIRILPRRERQANGGEE